MSTETFCEYKGKKYRLVWQGENEYGERAKLERLDGSKEFWVPKADILQMGISEAITDAADSFVDGIESAPVDDGRPRCPHCRHQVTNDEIRKLIAVAKTAQAKTENEGK